MRTVYPAYSMGNPGRLTILLIPLVNCCSETKGELREGGKQGRWKKTIRKGLGSLATSCVLWCEGGKGEKKAKTREGSAKG